MHYTQVHTDPNVFKVVIPFDGLVSTNCYIIQDGGDALLVDTGAPGEERLHLMQTALHELGVDLSSTRYFLTHLHFDHAGLLGCLASKKAIVYVSENDYRHYSQGLSIGERPYVWRELRQQGVPDEEMKDFERLTTARRLFDCEMHTFEFAREGAEISVGRYSFVVKMLPGHTPGHMGLWHRQSGLMFCGDHVLPSMSPSIALFPAEEDGLQEYLYSLKRILNMGCRKLFPAHGEFGEDFGDRIETIISHHESRLEEIIGLVAASSRQLSGYELIRLISWKIPDVPWREISFTQRWCIILEGISYLRNLVLSGRLCQSLNEEGVYSYHLEPSNPSQD